MGIPEGSPARVRGREAIRRAYEGERVAASYERRRFESVLGRRLHQQQARAVARVLRDARPRRVLELAPGPARLTRRVAAAGVDWVALDSSLAMLVRARTELARGERGVGHPLVCGDAFDPPLGRGFDLALTFRFLRHFAVEERRLLYASIRERLFDGGLLLFDAVNERVSSRLPADPTADLPAIFDASTRPEKLAAELATSGFELLRLEGVHHAYRWLRQIQILVGPRWRGLAASLIALVDRCGGEPLEWIVTCRRA